MQAGLDVSHFQGVIDWLEVAAAGRSFAFIKASEGLEHVDPMFEPNWLGSGKAGLHRGAYHFFLPELSAELQAEHFSAVLLRAGFVPGRDLPPAIDCEVRNGSSSASYENALRQILSVTEAQLGAKPLIYTSPGFWNGLQNPDFSEYGLWLADYTGSVEPEIPSPWTHYSFWQYSQDERIAGVRGACDSDRMSAAFFASE